ncbi:MAG: ABC transporter ATP-binding protein [Candidatus Bathyarchaeia archaeon]
MPSEQRILEVNNISAGYGELNVLSEVSFYMKEGEMVALLGANAMGKTTTLRAISGLIRPNSGEIIFDGRRINKVPPHKIVELGLIHVPEGRQLFTNMTVLENLEMGAYIKRAEEKIKDNMEFVFQLFPVLKERKHQLAGTLSGGEQQMLAIARGLMACPKLLMLDEPSSGLAPKLVEKLYETIKQVNAAGIALLIVEQYVMHALQTVERAYIMENGRIVLEGQSKDLLNNDYVKKVYLGL